MIRWVAAILLVIAVSGLAQAQVSPGNEQAARFEARLLQLEEQIRSLRGEIERLEFENRRRETELRSEIAALREQMLFTTSPSQVNDGEVVRSNDESTLPQEDGDQTDAVFAAGVLGSANPEVPSQESSVEPAGAETSPVEGAGRSATPATNDVAQQYREAVSLLQAGQWTDAQAAFEGFIDEHPEDDRTPLGAYWLGETYFAQGNFQTAAAIFAKNYRTYGASSPKASDNLLKLAISLARLGDLDRACQTFDELDRQNAEAALPIRQALARERRVAGC